MRKPEPFYWATRKGWYVQINKRQIRLGPDLDPRPKAKPRVPEAIMREYYRVMGANGCTDAADRLSATMAEVCELYLESKFQVRNTTRKLYTYYLRRLAEPLLGRQFRTVRKEDLVRIAESYVKWSLTTRHLFIRRAISLFRWARDAGYLDFNPLSGWENPYPEPRRVRSMTDDEFNALVDMAKDTEFKEVMFFLYGTACRVGEASAVEARHVHPDKPIVTLPPELHKTGRKTNRSRVIFMPPKVEAMIRALANRYPTGPLLRNSKNGKPWTPSILGRRVQRYRERLGCGNVTLHMIRHAALSRMLNQGADAHAVAKVAGHSSVATLTRIYYQADEDKLAAIVTRANVANEA